MLRQQKIN